jgi:two-component system, cell cycle sensor histidine kinase and response regulator CckA
MPDEISSRTVDLNAVIAEVAKLIHLIGGDKAAARIVLDPGLGRVQVDLRLIDWILVSLATRALGAMAEGSELVMSTADKELGPAAAGELKVPPGAYVQVEFTLAGAGMEVPSAVRQIVQRHHGAVSMRGDGGATTVAVLFPRVADELSSKHPPSGRKLTGPLILVVDDQPVARELTRQLLDKAGYLVLEAAGRDEAEAVLAACRVDLVITLGSHAQSLVKDHPHVRTIAARDVTSSVLLETVRREVGEPGT